MLYQLGDIFVLNNLEVKVSFINSQGEAYVAPVDDEDTQSHTRHLRGLVVGILDRHGRDKKTGTKALSVNTSACGAV